MATEATNKTPSQPQPPSSSCLTNTDEIKKVFNKFDKNSDGKISSSELVHIMKSLGSETSEEEVKQMMKTIDTDSDGYISLEEFTGFCKATSGDGGDGGGEDELKEAFDHYDLNKNGLISSSELHQILSKLGEKCTEEDCVKMIKSVDADGDGFVNFVEFQKMMSRSNGGGGGGGAGEGEGAA